MQRCGTELLGKRALNLVWPAAWPRWLTDAMRLVLQATCRHVSNALQLDSGAPASILTPSLASGAGAHSCVARSTVISSHKALIHALPSGPAHEG